MRLKLKKLVMSTFTMLILSASTAMASEVNSMLSDKAQQENTILLPEGTESSIDEVTAVERSSIVSSATVEIIDETGGDIGVVIETLAHVECEEIRNIAILDRYDEDTETWEELVRYEFIAEDEDFPNGLTALTNGFTIENQRTGYYYRIRGIHGVTANGTSQYYSTRTDGLLITEYGR